MHNFKVSTHVNLQRVNKLETLYGRSCLYVKVELLCLCVASLPFIHCLDFIHARKVYVHWQGEI